LSDYPMKAFFESCQQFYPPFNIERDLSSLDAACKVFVLGVQKSGTSAIAGLLSKCSGQSVCLDVRGAIAQPEWKTVMRFGIGCFEDYFYQFRDELQRTIVKEPGLTFYPKQLKTLFPRAKYVLVVRNPYATIRSTLNRLKLPGSLSRIDLNVHQEIAKSPAWRINLDSSWLGYCAENFVEALAYRWHLALLGCLSEIPEVTLVRYEDFLKDKKTSIEQLVEATGFQVQQDISDDVDKQFQVKGSSEADVNAFFGDNMRLIQRWVEPFASTLGYSVLDSPNADPYACAKIKDQILSLKAGSSFVHY